MGDGSIRCRQWVHRRVSVVGVTLDKFAFPGFPAFVDGEGGNDEARHRVEPCGLFENAVTIIRPTVVLMREDELIDLFASSVQPFLEEAAILP